MAVAPLLGALLLHGGCSHQPAATAGTGEASMASTEAGIADASAASTNSVALEAEDAGDASAPTAEKTARIPHVVLHVGDSTVGYYGGLSKALEARFKAEGAQYVHDVWTSASVVTFDHSDKFKKLIARHNPDLILITLGTNDVTIPSPKGFAHHIVNIAKKTEGRECIWLGPPTWKKDTGIVEVIRQNSAPCKFFDSSLMNIQRRADGIHPTDKGGEAWANLFWEFYRGESSPAPRITSQ